MSVQDFLTAVESNDEYWVDVARSDFISDLVDAMQEHGITNTELAKRIGSSKAYVTKVLRGNANFTLETMTKLARAVELIVRVRLAHPDQKMEWLARETSSTNSVQSREALSLDVADDRTIVVVLSPQSGMPRKGFHASPSRGW